jgi:hypothetical protein
MAKTYIDLNEQGEAGSISDALINVAADIATSKLATFSSHSIADGALISYPSSQLGNFSALDLVDKEYVDSVAVGLSVHAPVDYATAAALPAYTYFNGVLGVGATLTGTSFGALTVDGHLVSPGQRILVSNETGGNAPYNGIYTVTVAGDGSHDYVLTRATDANTNSNIQTGMFVAVLGGDTLLGFNYVLTTSEPITVGTTNLTFTLFSTATTNALTLQGLAASDFLRSTAASSLGAYTLDVMLGGEILFDSGSTLNLAAGSNFQIAGLNVTATAPELNALGTIVVREYPTGTTAGIISNGSDGSFNTVNFPIIGGSEEVFLNGVLQDEGASNDYVIVPGTGAIQFNAPFPLDGEKILVNYRY